MIFPPNHIPPTKLFSPTESILEHLQYAQWLNGHWILESVIVIALTVAYLQIPVLEPI